MSVEMGSDDDRSRIARESDAPTATGPETVAAVDEIDGRPHLIVADITRDGAWVAMTESTTVAARE